MTITRVKKTTTDAMIDDGQGRSHARSHDQAGDQDQKSTQTQMHARANLGAAKHKTHVKHTI